jgi:hypothetical protein
LPSKGKEGERELDAVNEESIPTVMAFQENGYVSKLDEDP